MLKTMKAEIYRLLKSKSFYVTLALLVGFTLLSVFTQSVGSIGMQTEATQQTDIVWSGYNIPSIQISMLSVLQYFFLPMLITIMGTDFSYNTYKNTLTKGVGRSKYYFSKLIILFFVCLFFTVVYIIVPTLVGTAIYGFHGEITWDYLQGILKTSVPQLIGMFMMLALAGIVLITSKKTVACTVGYLVIPIVIQIAFGILYEVNMDLCKTLFEFDLITKLNSFAAGIYENKELIKYTLLGIGYTIAAVFAGNYILKKADL